MCLVIAVVLAIFSFNAFMADNMMLGILTTLGSIGFIILMIRNILHVKKMKEAKHDH
jgi:uncharacterized YccA/Bax inhibitor family protein